MPGTDHTANGVSNQENRQLQYVKNISIYLVLSECQPLF